LAPSALRDLLLVPAPAWVAHSWNGKTAPPARLADLDRSAWEALSKADCEKLADEILSVLQRRLLHDPPPGVVDRPISDSRLPPPAFRPGARWNFGCPLGY